ncbi:adenosine kinase [Galdieria sulphuraria]|uniref:Adenosine kinase n=1 Tax=Galdieria sulphuraria TaxID=130081 RepID=M2W6U1_GALSU|nr:adenosine kinase [Galdieria sulphuraria]EME31521.1 adenosine kinase [Galdieria sulphuraria]|eukprot:XP_005708041.1 adenosine kinase [Galdieria sulphuraria]
MIAMQPKELFPWRCLAQLFTCIPKKQVLIRYFHTNPWRSENLISKNTILGIGNPLLDIVAADSLLEKYSLKPNNAILAEERHLPLFEELKRYPVEYIAGGDVLNSIRVAQWLLDKPESTTYFGAVGTDEHSKQLQKCATADRVETHFEHKPNLPTGVCGVLVTAKGFCRSLVAKLGAASHYSVEHLRAREQWELVKKAQIFYSSAFFCAVSPESLFELGTHACANDKTFCHNLAAPFLIENSKYFQILKDILRYVDIIFGNDAEARAFAKSMNWSTQNVTEIAQRMAREPKANACPRTVIVTRGTEPTIVAIGSSRRLWSVEEYGIIPCDPSELVDTTGAGDSFVGGFLAGLAKGVGLVECIAHANYAANIIVKRPGCNLPKQANYKWRGYTLRY